MSKIHKGLSTLPKEKRIEIAAKGGRMKGVRKATHHGELKILDKCLSCVVLENGKRLFTAATVFKVFGRPPRGNRTSKDSEIGLPPFIDANNIQSLIKSHQKKLISPIKYLDFKGDICFGFSVEIIPFICSLYLKLRREGILKPSQTKIADYCELIVESLSNVGIAALVDEVTGYVEGRPRDELQVYLNRMLSRELAEWSKTFPDSFYEQIYIIKKWTWHDMKKNHYSCVGHITNDLIYSRLGPGILDELKNRTPKDQAGNNENYYHQWFSEGIGNKKLDQHIAGVMALQRFAINNGWDWDRFLSMIDQVFPKKQNTIEEIKNLNVSQQISL